MTDTKTVKTKFVSVVSVQDPDTGAEVELEIHKDTESGAMFAIDSSFLDQVDDTIPSPFNKNSLLLLQHPDEDSQGETEGETL